MLMYRYYNMALCSIMATSPAINFKPDAYRVV